MTSVMLRAASSTMATAAAMLMGVALVLGIPSVATADGFAVCPAEPQNGQCAGTCQNAGDTCQKGFFTLPDGTKKPACACLPAPINPAG